MGLALVVWHITTFSCIAGDADQTWSSCCNWGHMQFVPSLRPVPDSMLLVFFFSLTPETLWVIYLTLFMLTGKHRRCNGPLFFICVSHHSVLLWSYKPGAHGVDVVGMFFSRPVVLGGWDCRKLSLVDIVGLWTPFPSGSCLCRHSVSSVLCSLRTSHLKTRAGEGIIWTLNADLYW